MIQATVNGHKVFSIENGLVNGSDAEWDLKTFSPSNFHVIRNSQCYRCTVLAFNAEEKTAVIVVNGHEYEIGLRDKYDLLLSQMGLGAGTASVSNTFKAPMPGLIRSLLVEGGSEVAKGDVLLILEAMKMENALKSPRAGIIKKINAVPGSAVEKGQVLIEFL